MKSSEQLMTELLETSMYEGIPLFEVVSTYAADNDIDPVELIKMFDADFIHRIKKSAVVNNERLKNMTPGLKRRSLI